MSASLPPLSSIRCFEAAARHGSFTRAAEELAMTQAAVSYQIKVLEDRLGAQLFVRGPRGVALTETGARLAPPVSDAFTQLRSAFDGVRENDESILSITSLGTFASNWLVPRIGEFQLANPGLAVRLDVSGQIVDLQREGVDIGIRSGKGAWPGLTSHRLMEIAFAPLLSPNLLQRGGPLKTPADLVDYPLIDPDDPWWPAWFALAGVPPPDLSRRTEIKISEQQLAARAALAGHGVAILMPSMFAAEIQEGRLVQPFPMLGKDPLSYWLVYPEARGRSQKIRRFRDWLLAKFESSANSPVQTAGDQGRDETG